MRDIIVTLAVLAGCFYTLKKPYMGILLWSWLGYMNPHRLCYGFAYSLPFAQITALTLFAAMLFSKGVRKPPLNAITALWIVFIIWMTITTSLAYFPADATEQYFKVLKIQLPIFLTMMLITDIKKLRELIWVIVLSIGYFSVKGGVFTLLTGGGFIVWGPSGTFIEDNNSLALAILMAIALMMFLYQTTDNKNIKKGLIAAITLSFFTVLGSQSRGALIAIASVGLVYWFKSNHKILSGFFIVILGAVLFAFMPETWHQRMSTIQSYEQDNSAMGRLNAWEYAFHAANDNFFGMGFDSWEPSTFALYAPNPADVHAAHSIYFSVLADHGWLGLILFLLFYFLVWRALAAIIKQTAKDSELHQFSALAKMLQVGLIAYFSGGAFLSLSYFDLPWHFASFVVILQRLLAERNDVSLESAVKVKPSTDNRSALMKIT